MAGSWISRIPKHRFGSVALAHRSRTQQFGRSISSNSNVTPRYTFAVTRDTPESFASAITKFAQDEDPIDLTTARKQHDLYVDRLRNFVPTICLPALQEHPDSVFVEDTVVAVRNRAVITNPGHPLRRGEVSTMKDVLCRLGLDVTDMREVNPEAFCDGGDVLYTGRHLFVGLSDRTNMAAVQILSEGLDVDETVAVPFEGAALHLKSIVTHIDSNTLLAPIGDLGDQVLEAIHAKDRGYHSIIRLPNMLACNVVSVNGGILAQDAGCSESRAILESVAAERNMKIEFVDMTETAKCDGALTCCSVLLDIDDLTTVFFPDKIKNAS